MRTWQVSETKRRGRCLYSQRTVSLALVLLAFDRLMSVLNGMVLKLRLNMKDLKKLMGKTRNNSLLNTRNVTRELYLGFRNAPLQAVLKYFQDLTDLDLEVTEKSEI